MEGKEELATNKLNSVMRAILDSRICASSFEKQCYLIDETFFFELNLFFKQGSLMKRIYTIYSELKKN